MGVNRPVYVAGLLRGVRPMGLWSTLMTLSNASSPSMRSCAAGSAWLWYSFLATAAYSVSFTSVLLPEPLTPVTQVKSPTGISTSTCLRLLPCALQIFSTLASMPGRLRAFGTSIFSTCAR